jgi:hypothetical protein
MSRWTHVSSALVTAAIAVTVMGCSKDEGATAPPAHSAPPPVVSTAAPIASAAASEEEPAPKHDCPEGSTGEGTLKAPCLAKGKVRMMEVAWTGKTTDEGPFFRVINKSQLTILYGKIVVYFYDKAGKQLEVQEGGTPPKTRPYQPCSGNLFSGVMKPGEKAVMTFSCVPKKAVPEGTATIEAEIETVGFADASEKKSEFFWRNEDLVPDARPKGGIKK